MPKFLNISEPIGGLNFDDDVEGVAIPFPPTDYTYSLNTRLGGRDDRYFNARKNIPGNKILNYVLPAGINRVIGCYEDKGGQSIVYFIWNSNLQHQILRWFQNINPPDGEIQLIAKGQIFNFDTNHLITGVGLQDGKLLYWTDGLPEEKTITGNPPRGLNIVRANITGKKLCYNIYVGTPGVQFGAGDEVWITLSDPITNVINNYSVYTAPAGIEGNLKEGFQQLADAINNDPVTNAFLEAETCGGCHLKICLKLEGDYHLSVIHPVNDWTMLTVPDNFLYGQFKPLKEEHITQIKSPPHCQPNITYGSDTTKPSNLVAGIQFQFAVRYIYYDNEKTTISPISGISIEDLLCGTDIAQSPNNFINVDFTEDRLSDPSFLEMIKGVEIIVREGNEGLWKSVKILEPCEIGIGTQIFKFYNDGQYPVLALVDTERLYDYVPLIASGLELAANRKFEGGYLENYDNIDCVDAELGVTYEVVEDCSNEGTWTITGRIYILGAFRDNVWGANQPIIDYGADGNSIGPVFGGMISDSDFVEGINAYHQFIPACGFTVYLAGTTHFDVSKQNPATNYNIQLFGINVWSGVIVADRDKVRQAMKGTNDNGSGQAYSTFTITGVKPGKYILRVASHLCDFAGTYGAQYDLNNGIEWQRTSTNISGMNTVYNQKSELQNGIQELVLDLPQGGGTKDIGYIGVYDLSAEDITASETSKVVTGYLIDDAGGSDQSKLKFAPVMERQLMIGLGTSESIHSPDETGNPAPIAPRGYTDHNGYFYWAENSTSGFAGPTEFVSVPAGTGANLIIRQTGQNILISPQPNTLTELNQGNLFSQANYLSSPGEFSVVIYNHNPIVSNDCVTFVKGNVKNTATVNLPGVKINITKVGRYDTTDSQGNFKMRVYGEPRIDSSKNTRAETLIYRFDSACCSTVNPPSKDFNIDKFIKNADYSSNFHFFLADLIVFFNSISVKQGWKHRNKVTMGLVYYDLYNRSTKVQGPVEFYIPFFTEPGGNPGIPSLNWLINHLPPVEAVHYQWVRLLNPLYNRYTQLVANEVQYVRRFDRSTDLPIPTTFAAADGTEIYISLEAFNLYTDENTGNVISYTFEPGDRIAFIKDENNKFYTDLFDYPIEGVRTFGGQVAIAIKLSESLPELKKGVMFEVYTPKRKADEEIYFEFSECYEILNPGTANRFHGKGAGIGAQDQTPTQPATGIFKGGDTYYRQRHIPTTGNPKVYFDRLSESEYIFDNIATSKQQSIGRPNNIDKDFRQTFFKSWVRYSGRYIPDSLVNGLSTFSYPDKIEIDENFGSVRKLAYVDTVMLSIHQFKIQPLYLGQRDVWSLDGESQITTSKDVANKAQPLLQDWGTHNPESVVIEEGRCYGLDIFKGVAWRYAGNGLTSISDYKAKRYFAEKGEILFPLKNIHIFGTYDRLNGEYILAFPPSPHRTIPARINPSTTISFSEPRNRWETFYSYLPEFFGRLGHQMVTFKNGQMWQHDKAGRNIFYGTQYPSIIATVLNTSPQAIKDFYTLRYSSNKRWSMAGEILPNSSFPNGMKTRLTKTRFQLTEGDFWAEFLRDFTDPSFTNQLEALQRGRKLKGKIMLVTLTNDDPDEVVLHRIDIISGNSMLTM